MQIIPAIDIFQNQCVRLTGGLFSRRTEYALEPGAVAERFVSEGASYLHVVDLEGAKEGKVTNWKSLEDVARASSGLLQIGGGIRTDKEIDRLFDLGADRVVIGSIALKSPETLLRWIHKYGSAKICIALDVKENGIAYAGWQEVDKMDIIGVAGTMVEAGIKTILSTDITRDGRLSGPNITLYRVLVEAFPDVMWLASGGVHSAEDITALRGTGVSGVIVGKALYEGSLTLREILE